MNRLLDRHVSISIERTAPGATVTVLACTYTDESYLVLELVIYFSLSYLVSNLYSYSFYSINMFNVYFLALAQRASVGFAWQNLAAAVMTNSPDGVLKKSMNSFLTDFRLCTVAVADLSLE